MDTIRWGILGAGRIAGAFAQGLRDLADAQLVAVGSRAAATADTFGERYAIPHRHGSYQALVDDPEVDVVYVATPHPMHMENTLLCLRAGKPVLCEKPFALHAGQAAAMIAEARARGLFLMEAMWTRFLPHIARVRALLASGAIGEVRMLKADFCFRTELDPASRLFDPALGGGALLDVGIYPVSLASMVFGAPEQIASLAHLGATGVDEQAALILGYSGGRMAALTCAIRTSAPHQALLLGAEGMITIHHEWWRPTLLTLSIPGRPDQPIEVPAIGNGYSYEAAEVMQCLRAGRRESATMPLDETLAIIRTLDRARAQWGLRYPGEEARPG